MSADPLSAALQRAPPQGLAVEASAGHWKGCCLPDRNTIRTPRPVGDVGSQWRGGGSGNCLSRPLTPRRIPQTTQKVIFSTGQVITTHSLEWPCVSSRCKLIKGREVAQSCPTPCDPMDCTLPGSSVHGVFQAEILEWVASSRRSSLPRD